MDSTFSWRMQTSPWQRSTRSFLTFLVRAFYDFSVFSLQEWIPGSPYQLDRWTAPYNGSSIESGFLEQRRLLCDSLGYRTFTSSTRYRINEPRSQSKLGSISNLRTADDLASGSKDSVTECFLQDSKKVVHWVKLRPSDHSHLRSLCWVSRGTPYQSSDLVLLPSNRFHYSELQHHTAPSKLNSPFQWLLPRLVLPLKRNQQYRHDDHLISAILWYPGEFWRSHRFSVWWAISGIRHSDCQRWEKWLHLLAASCLWCQTDDIGSCRNQQ